MLRVEHLSSARGLDREPQPPREACRRHLIQVSDWPALRFDDLVTVGLESS
jgi:hypothetical protein